jgi:hypothetical protein
MKCNKKHSNSLSGNGRILSLDELKNNNHSHVYIQAKCGCFLRVSINGKAQTWKTRPSEVKIPYKYGLYEYGYITENDIVKVEA